MVIRGSWHREGRISRGTIFLWQLRLHERLQLLHFVIEISVVARWLIGTNQGLSSDSSIYFFHKQIGFFGQYGLNLNSGVGSHNYHLMALFNCGIVPGNWVNHDSSVVLISFPLMFTKSNSVMEVLHMICFSGNQPIWEYFQLLMVSVMPAFIAGLHHNLCLCGAQRKLQLSSACLI